MEIVVGLIALVVGLVAGFFAGTTYIFHQLTKDPWK